MDSARSSSVVLYDIVFYDSSLVGAVGRGGVGVWVKLRLCDTMGSSSLVFLLSGIVMRLSMAL